jgi:hypothetical protein
MDLHGHRGDEKNSPMIGNANGELIRRLGWDQRSIIQSFPTPLTSLAKLCEKIFVSKNNLWFCRSKHGIFIFIIEFSLNNISNNFILV